MAKHTPQQMLRHATRQDHDAIDAGHPIRAVLAGESGWPGYHQILRRLACWYQPVEAQMQQQAVLTTVPLAATRWAKTCWLQADLAALGDVASIQPAPVTARLTPVDPFGWLGWAYVLEGATLGGMVLSRHLQERLGTTLPCRFYQGYGGENGQYWQSMVAHLNQILADPAALDCAIAGAQGCFASLSGWLEHRADYMTHADLDPRPL